MEHPHSPDNTTGGMDWFSWLSRSNLEPSLVYEYGLAFARNELQKEDLTYFDHEFLQSMGIAVAKHRLEILKVAWKDVRGSPKKLSRLVVAINKTKKSISKCINKWVFQQQVDDDEPIKTSSSQQQEQEQWRGALTRKYKSDKELVTNAAVMKPRRIAKSGPLDGRLAQENKLMITNKTLKLSGPLDRNMQERLVFTYRSPITSDTNRSPKLSGPLDRRPPSPRVYSCKDKSGGYDDQTLWSALFQDLKPT
ncbi:hypothetical protein LWI28_012063 [Acer negundo]|uniref:SAM domain-containing protein n=1 Tax=Acer negundo TaxID=4023 RepID=A0AAD5JB20_ACENE|nr:hypothetical protein LWI28_012063 [Acer negundo]KAK4854045.1 hypothetical protein QYF36_018173 [Acer negundo]